MEENRLIEYGKELVAAGLEVWHTPIFPGDGYLTYRDPSNDCWGTLQEEYFGGWHHHMPIKPSREFGSSMYIGRPVEDPFTVEAAKQCASPANHNETIGTHKNAMTAFLSSSSVKLEAAA